MYTIALTDDHTMLRNALAATLQNYGFKVVAETANGDDLFHWLTTSSTLPDVVILDITMPGTSGFDVCRQITTRWSTIKIIALSMNDDELSIMQMLHAGAKGFISKDEKAQTLKEAIDRVMAGSHFLSEQVTGLTVAKALASNTIAQNLTNRELEFLRLNCSDMSYKHIAQKMYVSPRTIENYRDSLYQKLQVNSRMALALLSIKQGWVKL
jgi:DNA-binding NarL/FixJ family response regulator